MTHNQIEFWKLKETERANKAQESENVRTHKQTESINAQGVAENVRHNIELERLQGLSLEESARHNAASEGEAIRSNMENESIRRTSNEISLGVGLSQIEASKYGAELSAAASRYATSANVAEATRHNLATEEYSYFKSGVDKDIASMQDTTKNRDITLSYGIEGQKLVETVRHNENVESETRRHNAATELQERIAERNRTAIETERNTIQLINGIVNAGPKIIPLFQ